MPSSTIHPSASSAASPLLLRGLGVLLAFLGIVLACGGLFNLISPVIYAFEDNSIHSSIFGMLSALGLFLFIILLNVRILWLSGKEFLQLVSAQADSYSCNDEVAEGKGEENLSLQASMTSFAPSLVMATQSSPSGMQQAKTVHLGLPVSTKQLPLASSDTNEPSQSASTRPSVPLAPVFDWSQAVYPPYPVGSYAVNSMEREAILYTPIDQDLIFQLESAPDGVRCLMLPKEGEPLVECQDRYALDGKQHRYALADGVSNSFVPGPWARIIAQQFIEHGGQFTDEEMFRQWLAHCSQRWHQWMEERWVQTMNALRQRNGEIPRDWSDDIRKGAQTTLIGCTLHPPSPEQPIDWRVDLLVIGDCNFLLFRQNAHGQWSLEAAFPYETPEAFGSRPHTLMTLMRPDLIKRAWLNFNGKTYRARPGDLIVLATDSLAKWLLAQDQQQGTHLQKLLNAPQLDALEPDLREELHHGAIEDDDLTMLAISVPSLEETMVA